MTQRSYPTTILLLLITLFTQFLEKAVLRIRFRCLFQCKTKHHCRVGSIERHKTRNRKKKESKES